MHRISLIQDEFRSLMQDFTGFGFDPLGFSYKLLQFLLVGSLFFTMYCIGRIVERNFFNGIADRKLSVFISFAMGFIVVASLIFLLGLFSILTTLNVMMLMFLLLCVSIFDAHKNRIRIGQMKSFNKWSALSIISAFFVIIYFLRLLPPSVNGDGNDYHIGFPRVYLSEQTLMIPPLGDESYSTVPHLPEMLFIPSQIISNGEMSRIIHFGFFILVFLLLFKYNIVSEKYPKISQITALLFISSPLILHISTSPFSDFPAILCLILSGYILIKAKPTKGQLILSGILMGGALASKVWVFVIFPVYLIFLILICRKSGLGKIIKFSLIYAIFALVVPSLWLVRSFLLTGNPLYVNENLGRMDAHLSLMKYILQGFGPTFFTYRFGPTLDFGLIYILGILLALLNSKKLIKIINKKYLYLVLILFAASMVLPFSLASGRYSLPYIIPLYSIAAAGLYLFYSHKIGKVLLLTILWGLVAYYSLNTFLQLPYGLGLADTTSYIKRNLLRDPVAYYDFNGVFSREIEKDETVITYGMRIFSYAHFRHKNIYYFIDQDANEFVIPQNTTNKLLIRGGDYKWMCEKEKIVNCDAYTFKEITSDTAANQYLYVIKDTYAK